MSASGFDARLVPIVCYLIIALMFLFLFDIRKVLKD